MKVVKSLSHTQNSLYSVISLQNYQLLLNPMIDIQPMSIVKFNIWKVPNIKSVYHRTLNSVSCFTVFLYTTFYVSDETVEGMLQTVWLKVQLLESF